MAKSRKCDAKGCTIEVKGVNKYYNKGLQSEVHVLKDVNVCFDKGSFVSIMGPSGSGKTTLLDIIGCLLKPTSGTVYLDGIDTSKLSDNQLATIRGKTIGFIFQQYNLVNSFTALENVELAMRINGKPKNEARKRATKLLDLVGLSHRVNNRPTQMSGGEQQRVAIARALSNEPKVILGDEPTGNLDTKTGGKILDLLKRLNKEEGYTIINVTHDPEVGKIADKVIHIRDGMITGKR
ncbi:MAG: macrolide ABC transporter ATP-binding protein [Candidatus Aenigmatarchaeota archaeon]|nr:MAG: macrolide ABC transporter ATP-binding protein [Candidatus Aenigmarchaeota archaeon]